jgi:hypothetical protein
MESSEILVNIDNNNNINDDGEIYVLSSFLLFSTNNVDDFNNIDNIDNNNIDDDGIDDHGGIYFFKLFSFIFN